MGQFLPIAMAVAGTALQQSETRRVERKQDDELGRQLIALGQKRSKADARVDEEVSQVENSRSGDERAERMEQYMQMLRRGKSGVQAGLTPEFGSQTFRADSQQAANDALAYATDQADLTARIDAPLLQRQGEAFGYGRLATDIDQIGREVAGQRFVDELRMRGIRRRPGVDLVAGGLAGAGTAMAGGLGGGSGVGPVVPEAIPLPKSQVVVPNIRYGGR